MNKSGLIFPVVIWILIAVVSIVLIQRQFVRNDLLLSSYGKDHRDALANAFSGVAWAQYVIGKWQREEDTFYSDKIAPEGEWAGKFLLLPYVQTNADPIQGIGNEAGKINLNAIDSANVRLLERLFIVHGIKQAEAQEISMHVLNWRSENSDSQLTSNGERQVKFKKRPFESIEEVKLLPGVTHAIFVRIKDDLTVYPKQMDSSGFMINVLTASVAVRTALAHFIKESDPVFNDKEVLSLWQRAQVGNDGKPYTIDDGTKGLTEDEKRKLLAPYVQIQAQVYRVIICGLSQNKKVRVYMQALFEKESTIVTEGSPNGSGVKLIELRQIKP